MPKAAHIVLKTWFRAVGQTLTTDFHGAPCGRYPDLPWTDDARPTPEQVNAMRAVCSSCPLIASCALHAATGGPFGRPVEGGFYAGVWLPWHSPGEGENTREMRRDARRHVRILAGLRDVHGHRIPR